MAEPNDRMGIAAPEDPTMKQSVQQAIANFLLDTGLVSDNYRAQRTGEAIIGTTREDAPGLGIGLTDFTPLGLAFIPEEVGEQVDKGNYATAGIVGGLSALEAYPLTKAIAKPTKNFLMNLATKATPTSVPFDQTRRDLMQGSLAAGALSTLPVVQQVAKVVGDAPVAKVADTVASKQLLPNFSLDAGDTFDFINKLTVNEIATNRARMEYGDWDQNLARAEKIASEGMTPEKIATSIEEDGVFHYLKGAIDFDDMAHSGKMFIRGLKKELEEAGYKATDENVIKALKDYDIFPEGDIGKYAKYDKTEEYPVIRGHETVEDLNETIAIFKKHNLYNEGSELTRRTSDLDF